MINLLCKSNVKPRMPTSPSSLPKASSASAKPRLLVTGPTGNVGLALIQALHPRAGQVRVIAAVRDIPEARSTLGAYDLEYAVFDFADSGTFEDALRDVDIVFLLRPPQLAKVDLYFAPFIQACVLADIQHIIFLSVQGVETSKLILHHKIESLIVQSGIKYTFLRPAYFMQNFTESLRPDLVERQLIFLPAGNAKFTSIDVKDVGEVAAKVVEQPKAHENTAYDLTSAERLSFTEMAVILSEELQVPIRYISPNPLAFYISKHKQGLPSFQILVMIMLHYLPRFQAPPPIHSSVPSILKYHATTFRQFVKANHSELIAVT